MDGWTRDGDGPIPKGKVGCQRMIFGGKEKCRSERDKVRQHDGSVPTSRFSLPGVSWPKRIVPGKSPVDGTAEVSLEFEFS